jgi:hypothetical protein
LIGLGDLGGNRRHEFAEFPGMLRCMLECFFHEGRLDRDDFVHAARVPEFFQGCVVCSKDCLDISSISLAMACMFLDAVFMALIAPSTVLPVYSLPVSVAFSSC